MSSWAQTLLLACSFPTRWGEKWKGKSKNTGGSIREAKQCASFLFVQSDSLNSAKWSVELLSLAHLMCHIQPMGLRFWNSLCKSWVSASDGVIGVPSLAIVHLFFLHEDELSVIQDNAHQCLSASHECFSEAFYLLTQNHKTTTSCPCYMHGIFVINVALQLLESRAYV